MFWDRTLETSKSQSISRPVLVENNFLQYPKNLHFESLLQFKCYHFASLKMPKNRRSERIKVTLNKKIRLKFIRYHWFDKKTSRSIPALGIEYVAQCLLKSIFQAYFQYNSYLVTIESSSTDSHIQATHINAHLKCEFESTYMPDGSLSLFHLMTIWPFEKFLLNRNAMLTSMLVAK